MRFFSSMVILASLLALVAVGCSESPQEIQSQNQTRDAGSTGSLFSALPGEEMLGDIGIPFPPSSGVVIAGVGLINNQPGDITITVPGQPVLSVLYWCGHHATDGTDLDITLEGNPLSGQLIGGPKLFFGGAWSSTVRADISGLNLITTGTQTISVGGLDFTTDCPSNCQNLGAGLLVVYEDGTDAEISIRDGNDNAFKNFTGDLQSTEPVIYTFAAEDQDRTATLCMFAASVAQFPSEGGRPNVVDVSFDVGPSMRLVDVFQGNVGDDFDAVNKDVTIPANASQMTVQAKSEKDPSSTFTGQPASFSWMVSALVVPVTPPPPEIEGCRVTGGGVNEVGQWDGTFNNGQAADRNEYTMGGQAGAPTAVVPRPYGEWTHHNKKGVDGGFTFHAGTASAPPGTEIAWIECMDPDWCVQARKAPFKQIDFGGIGTFKNLKPNVPWKSKVTKGSSLHYFEVNIDDLGEPGRRGKVDPPASKCPADGFGRNAATELADCDCPDYYRFTVYEGQTPDPNKILYSVEGYIRGGNFQIHPLTGREGKDNTVNN